MIGLQEVMDAQARLEGVSDLTPCIRADNVSLRVQANVYLKLENLQVTGSFKVRGAFNAISQLSAKEKKRGVIAASAGNHSQGVAYSAKKLHVGATIVMPTITPLIKIKNTKALGAEVILHGENFDASFSYAKQLAKKKNKVLIHAFDDPNVIAGQGTIGVEILEQMKKCDVVIVPIGGGGMISGIATAVKALSPKTKIIGVQAKGAPAMYHAWKGKRKTYLPQTIADGIAIKHPGKNTLKYIKKYVDKIVLVDEQDMTAAIVRLLESRKLIAEPAGIAALAAVNSGKIKLKGKTAVCVISGGNIDVRMLSAIIRDGMVKEGRVFEFTTVVPDSPGGLSALTELVAEEGANVLAVQHERLNPHAKVTDVELSVIVETSDKKHIKQVQQALKKGGYKVVH